MRMRNRICIHRNSVQSGHMGSLVIRLMNFYRFFVSFSRPFRSESNILYSNVGLSQSLHVLHWDKIKYAECRLIYAKFNLSFISNCEIYREWKYWWSMMERTPDDKTGVFWTTEMSFNNAISQGDHNRTWTTENFQYSRLKQRIIVILHASFPSILHSLPSYIHRNIYSTKK